MRQLPGLRISEQKVASGRRAAVGLSAMKAPTVSTAPPGYAVWLAELKTRIRQTRLGAALAVNVTPAAAAGAVHAATCAMAIALTGLFAAERAFCPFRHVTP